jgi:hypothetical protein
MPFLSLMSQSVGKRIRILPLIFALLLPFAHSSFAASCMDSVSSQQREQFVELTDSLLNQTEDDLTDDQMNELVRRTGAAGVAALQLELSLSVQRRRLRRKIESERQIFFSAAQAYMESAQSEASWVGLLKHEFEDETAAGRESEKNYKIMIQVLQDLNTLGFSSADLIPYRKVLIVALQSTHYDDGLKQINDAFHLAYEAPIVVPLFLAFPVLGKSFLFGLGAGAIKTGVTEIRNDESGNKGEMLCEVARSLANDSPEIIQHAVIGAPLGLLPWKKVPWKIVMPLVLAIGSVEVYEEKKKTDAETTHAHDLETSIRALTQALPSDDDRLAGAEKTYLQQNGKPMSEQDIEALKQMFAGHSPNP